MTRQKIRKIAAVVDSSFTCPISFSLSEGDLKSEDLDRFFESLDVYFCSSSQIIHEFAGRYVRQHSLFIQPISTVSPEALQTSKAIYLSSNGEFSLTADVNGLFPINVFNSAIGQKQPTLWQSSFQWQARLSFEDKNAISLASTLSNMYEGVAVLTNDWALRQQCTLYEGIDVYGTCSMLAGLVLSNIITYQKGTSIYKTWFKEEPRWVPTNLLEKRKWTFREVLDFERARIQQSKSFWTHS